MIGFLQARPIYELIFFAHVGHDVFPLVPTAALHLHEAAEDLPDSGVGPFGAIEVVRLGRDMGKGQGLRLYRLPWRLVEFTRHYVAANAREIRLPALPYSPALIAEPTKTAQVAPAEAARIAAVLKVALSRATIVALTLRLDTFVAWTATTSASHLEPLPM